MRTASTAHATADPATASRALFALAHTSDAYCRNATLQAVAFGDGGGAADAQLLLGWTAVAAPDVVLVMLRSAQRMGVTGDGGSGTSVTSDTQSLGSAMLTQLIQGLDKASRVLGVARAWALLEKLASAQVMTPAAWQQLAQQLAMQRQRSAAAAAPPAAGAGAKGELVKGPLGPSPYVRRVLSRAWSSVEWGLQNGDDVCKAMPG